MSFGQIIDQGMQAWFTHVCCFIEEESHIIAHGCRKGRMFILKMNDVGTEMFSKGQKVESDIDLWHKRIGFKSCNRNKFCSACRSSMAERPKSVKYVN